MGRGHRRSSSSPRVQKSLPRVPRRLHRAVRAQRARQRLDVQDDPRHLPGQGAGQGLAGEAAAAYGRRLSGASMGLIGAVGALGGLGINLAFRQSFLSAGSGTRRSSPSSPSTRCASAVTWAVYLRRGAGGGGAGARRRRCGGLDGSGGGAAAASVARATGVAPVTPPHVTAGAEAVWHAAVVTARKSGGPGPSRAAGTLTPGFGAPEPQRYGARATQSGGARRHARSAAGAREQGDADRRTASARGSPSGSPPPAGPRSWARCCSGAAPPVLHAPALRIVPLADDTELLAATKELIDQAPDVVVATTAIGFRGWVEAADGWGLGEELLDRLRGVELLARGPKVQGRDPGRRADRGVVAGLRVHGRGAGPAAGGGRRRAPGRRSSCTGSRCPGSSRRCGPGARRSSASPSTGGCRRRTSGRSTGCWTRRSSRGLDAVTFTSAPAAASLLSPGRGARTAARSCWRRCGTRCCRRAWGRSPRCRSRRRASPRVQPERFRLGPLVQLLCQ